MNEVKSVVFFLLIMFSLSANGQHLDRNVRKAYDRLEARDTTGAISYFNKAIILDPKGAEALIGRAKIKIARKYFEEALKDLDLVLERSPEYSRAYWYRGIVFELRNDVETALLEYTKAIIIDPFSKDFSLSRGNLFYLMEEYPKAILDYTKYIELNNANAGVYWKRAQAKLHLSDKLGAIADLSEVIGLSDTYGDAYFLRGKLFLEFGEAGKSCLDFS
jgi:tetratricopeptide (TPR) repeat protein